jgi:octaprenyl-diphosphate synthase
VLKLIQKVEKSGGIQYAEGKMMEYRDKALTILDTLDESQAKESLKELVLFTTERKN